MLRRDKKSSDLCQYQEKKYDIFLKTDMNCSGGPLLGLKYSMKERKAHEFISKSQVNYAGSTNKIKLEGLYH